MYDILLNVRKYKLPISENILNALYYTTYNASGSNSFVTKEDIKSVKTLQQLDLMVPGKFAKEVSDTLLESAGDISYWMLGKGLLKSFSVQCLVADSGAEPALVSLVVNGVKVYALEVKSSILNTYEFITPEDTYIETGDRIELSLDYTGTNADSENLRAFIVVETGY